MKDLFQVCFLSSVSYGGLWWSFIMRLDLIVLDWEHGRECRFRCGFELIIRSEDRIVYSRA